MWVLVLGVWVLGFGDSGFEFRVWVLGFGAWDLGVGASPATPSELYACVSEHPFTLQSQGKAFTLQGYLAHKKLPPPRTLQ